MTVAGRFAGLSGKRIVVAGASGFIGRRFIALSAELSTARLAGFSRSARAAAALRADGAEPLFVETADPVAIAAALQRADAFVNLAYDYAATPAENIALFTRFLDSAEKAGVRRVVHLSSIVVYEGWPSQALTEDAEAARPLHPYKRAKLEMEREAASRSDRLEIVVLQPTCVYGPGSAFWTDAPALKLATGRVVLPMNGRGAFNGVFVDDVATAIASAIVAPRAAGERFIINGADAPTWGDLYSAYAEAIGRPAPLLEAGAPAVASALPDIEDGGQPAFAQKAVAALTRLAGREETAAIKRGLMRLKGKVRPTLWRPAPHDMALYCASARPSSAKAAALIDWWAETLFQDGLRATAPYLRRRYGKP